MRQKQYIPTNNCRFHLGRGFLTILPTTLSFTHKDCLKAYRMAVAHAKIKKIAKPRKMNRIDNIPVLMEVA